MFTAVGEQKDDALVDDVSALDALTESILAIEEITTEERRKMITIDIRGALLNSDFNNIWMPLAPRQDHDQVPSQARPFLRQIVESEGTCAVQLDKATHLWYETITGKLREDGLAAN